MRRRPRVVYVVTRDDFYDENVCGYFSTRARAERYVADQRRYELAEVENGDIVLVHDPFSITEHRLDARRPEQRRGCYQADVKFREDVDALTDQVFLVRWQEGAEPQPVRATRHKPFWRAGEEPFWVIRVSATARTRAEAVAAVRRHVAAIMEGAVTVPIPDGADAQ